MSSDETTVIRTQGLSKVYKGVTALQDLDLTVRRHSICGFLGPQRRGQDHHHQAPARIDPANRWHRHRVSDTTS